MKPSRPRRSPASWTQAEVKRLTRAVVDAAQEAGLMVSAVEAELNSREVRVRVLTKEGAVTVEQPEVSLAYMVALGFTAPDNAADMSPAELQEAFRDWLRRRREVGQRWREAKTRAEAGEE